VIKIAVRLFAQQSLRWILEMHGILHRRRSAGSPPASMKL
jgi:hypothetical protein